MRGAGPIPDSISFTSVGHTRGNWPGRLVCPSKQAAPRARDLHWIASPVPSPAVPSFAVRAALACCFLWAVPVHIRMTVRTRCMYVRISGREVPTANACPPAGHPSIVGSRQVLCCYLVLDRRYGGARFIWYCLGCPVQANKEAAKPATKALPVAKGPHARAKVGPWRRAYLGSKVSI